MKRTLQGTKQLFLAAWLVGLTLAAPSLAADVAVNWQAGASLVAMPDGETVTMWGFAATGQTPFSPADPMPPVIRATMGDRVIITLTNTLPEPVSVVINGQTATETDAMVPTWTDGTAGPRMGDLAKRVRSFTHEASTGGPAVTYEWDNVRPGTYLIQSGSHQSVQVPMGLYAVLIVDADPAADPKVAYDASPRAVEYDTDVVLLFSEVDPAMHSAVASGAYGTPAYRTTLAAGYTPKYFFINGRPYSSSVSPLIAGGSGDRTLLRFLNAGLRPRVPVVHDAYLELVAEDGNTYNIEFGTVSQYSLDLPPGKTLDAVLDPAPSGYLPVYDRRLGLVNNLHSPGGMLVYLGFGTPDRTLTVSRIGTGSGTVAATGMPGGIDCGTDCTEAYVTGTEVSITAFPDPNSVFTGWLPASVCSGSYPVCTVSMDANRSVTARFATHTAFVEQLYLGFFDRVGDPAGIQYWVRQISLGNLTPAEVVEEFLLSPESENFFPPVTRLYFAYFTRIPDYSGLMWWVGLNRSGTPIESISDFFAGSTEFQSLYGAALTNVEFVTLVYQNVLGRTPDAEGLAFWTGQLDSGSMTRGEIMLGFSQSPEFTALSGSGVYVTMVYAGLLGRVPTQGEFDLWVAALDSGTPGLHLIETILNSAEFAALF